MAESTPKTNSRAGRQRKTTKESVDSVVNEVKEQAAKTRQSRAKTGGNTTKATAATPANDSKRRSEALRTPEIIGQERVDFIDPNSGSGSGLVEYSVQQQLAQINQPDQNIADAGSLLPTDLNEIGPCPQTEENDAQEKLKAIRKQENTIKVMTANANLSNSTEAYRASIANLLKSRVIAARNLETVSTEIAKHNLQVESTALEVERGIHKTIETENLRGLKDLVLQEGQQKQALKSAQIAKLEARTAQLLNNDISADVIDVDAIPVDY